MINPSAHGLKRIGLEFIATAFGRAEETRKPSPIQGCVRRATPARWNRAGSRSWMAFSVFRAILDDEEVVLFARGFWGSSRTVLRRPERSFEAPNPKLQAPRKSQIPSSKAESGSRPTLRSL